MFGCHAKWPHVREYVGGCVCVYAWMGQRLWLMCVCALEMRRLWASVRKAHLCRAGDVVLVQRKTLAKHDAHKLCI